MSTAVLTFTDLEAEFNAYIGAINYATMVTVDAKDRPRTRVLIPVWEKVDGEPLGWLATYLTPVKATHIAGNPHTNFSYWAPGNNSVAVDAVVRWDNALATREHVWDLYRKTSPRGAGYHLGNFWKAPSDPQLHVLRLTPWRIQVIRGIDLRSGSGGPTKRRIHPYFRGSLAARSNAAGGRSCRSGTFARASCHCWTPRPWLHPAASRPSAPLGRRGQSLGERHRVAHDSSTSSMSAEPTVGG